MQPQSIVTANDLLHKVADNLAGHNHWLRFSEAVHRPRPLYPIGAEERNSLWRSTSSFSQGPQDVPNNFGSTEIHSAHA